MKSSNSILDIAYISSCYEIKPRKIFCVLTSMMIPEYHGLNIV